MIVLTARTLNKGWKISQVEDLNRNRYIEIHDEKGSFVKSISPSDKMYDLFVAILNDYAPRRNP